MFRPAMTRFCVFLTTAFLLMLLNGCQANGLSNFSIPGSDPGLSADSKDIIDDSGHGNTAGNLANLGVVCPTDKWIYYRNYNDYGKMYRQRIDGSDREKITDNCCVWLNVVGEWVYYQNASDDNRLYRVKTDGSSLQKLNDDHSDDICVAGEWIYYQNDDNGEKMYRIRTDGSGRQQLTETVGWSLSTDGQWVYYDTFLGNYQFRFCRLKSNTLDPQILNFDHAYEINAAVDWVYYINWGDNMSLYRIKPDGSGREKISDESCQRINVNGDWIYYISINDQHRPYRMKTDGSRREKLGDDPCECIDIAADHLYYVTLGDNPVMYCMNTDGSSKEVVQ